MPVVTLRYTLPDEQSDFDAARQGGEAKRVLWQIDERLRAVCKHGSPSAETRRLAEEIRQMIHDSPENLLD